MQYAITVREQARRFRSLWGEVMVVIYNSLAQSYKDTVAELEEMSGRKFTRIHVVGGGCQDMFLNQKIKTFTGKEVLRRDQ